MGNSASSPVQTCLLSAVGNNRSLVAFPDQLFYQASSVKPYNLNIPVSPVAVTFPESSQQVADIVKCAVTHGYKVQPKSGGHSYGNYGLGGKDPTIAVDLMHLQQFAMDESTHVATIGGGTLLSDVTSRLFNAGGRAMAHGTCPQVGSGGHFTIGGLGPTSRQWGSSLDHVEEVEVVLANSSIVRANKDHNQDILFAVKGAAASFGIVTEFKVRTEEAPGEAVQYMYQFNMGNAADRANLLKDWQSFISDPTLTRKFSSLLTVVDHGILLTGIFYGTQEEFDDLNIEKRFPIKGPGNVIILNDWLTMTGQAIDQLALGIGGSVQTHFYAKSMAFTAKTLMSSSTIDELVHYLDTADKGTLLWFLEFDLEGGAVNDVPTNATAYAHRDTLYWVQTYVIELFGSVSKASVDFLDGIHNIVCKSNPTPCTKAYPGYVDPYLPNAQHAYWGKNLPRLEEIKAAIDPDDVFHNPQSVAVRR